MLIKIGEELRRAVLGIPTDNLVPLPGSFPVNTMSEIAPLVPDWLPPLIAVGSIVVIDQDDWESIPWEVREFLEVIHR